MARRPSNRLSPSRRINPLRSSSAGLDGTVYFARQLAAGEAYRAPTAVKGLVVDVSDPQAFDIYANGTLQGQLQANQTPLNKLNG